MLHLIITDDGGIFYYDIYTITTSLVSGFEKSWFYDKKKYV